MDSFSEKACAGKDESSIDRSVPQRNEDGKTDDESKEEKREREKERDAYHGTRSSSFESINGQEEETAMCHRQELHGQKERKCKGPHREE